MLKEKSSKTYGLTICLKAIIRSKGLIWAAEDNNNAYLFEQAGKQCNISNAGQWVATAPKKVRQKMMQDDPTLMR